MAAGKQHLLGNSRLAIDIGSTVIKVAHIGHNDELLNQDFYPRDHETSIARQVESILDQVDFPFVENDILICSSANGGLRVGIICLSKRFSGAELRNQALAAGANPIFIHEFDDQSGSPTPVDILLIGGGIDCEDSSPLEERLRRFQPRDHHFGTLVYAGNKYLADQFKTRFPEAVLIPNPFGATLRRQTYSVFETLRRSYLDDLIYKEGVSELRNNLPVAIRPTPEAVNYGFRRAVFNHSTIDASGPCILIDIGGATTDIHYTVEIIRDDSNDRPSAGSSISRYVFTDLGVASSRDNTVLQIRSHPRIYEFLSRVIEEDARETYQLLLEGEYQPSAKLLSYACLFLCLDRFARGKSPGLPAADLSKVTHIMLTGGAAQTLDIEIIKRIFSLSLPEGGGPPRIFIDRRHQLWVDGITWKDNAIT